jgi:hypothetical protein
MCFPENVSDRFLRVSGLLSALKLVVAANADLDTQGYSGAVFLVGELEEAAEALKSELKLTYTGAAND